MEEGDDSKATGKMLRAPIPFPTHHYHFHDSSDARVVQGGVEINNLEWKGEKWAISELAWAATGRAVPVALRQGVAQPEHLLKLPDRS